MTVWFYRRILPIPLISQFLTLVRPLSVWFFGIYLLIVEMIEKYKGKSTNHLSRNNCVYDFDIFFLNFFYYREN